VLLQDDDGEDDHQKHRYSDHHDHDLALKSSAAC
jgi:hypothetical protein